MTSLPSGWVVSTNVNAISCIGRAAQGECHITTFSVLEDMMSLFPRVCTSVKVIFLDLDVLPPAEMIEQFQILRETSHIPEVIAFTRHGSQIGLCRDIMRLGAFDYLVMPLSEDHVRQTLRKAVRYSDSIHKLVAAIHPTFSGEFAQRSELISELVAHRRREGKVLGVDELRVLIPTQGMEFGRLNEAAKQEAAPLLMAQAPISVLIVEDEASVRDSLIDLFRSRRFKPLGAANAAEAIALATRHPEIEMMCLDIGLPDTNGIALLRELKTILPDAEAVMITAYEKVDMVVTSFHETAVDYLLKPYDEMELLAIVSKSLQRRYLTKALSHSEDSFWVNHGVPSAVRMQLLQDLAEKRLLNRKSLLMSDVYLFFPELRSCGLPDTHKVSRQQVEDGVLLMVEALLGC